jgi:cytochrome oxidase Cu insertion factor (SCO1/SenC/PrrC family)
MKVTILAIAILFITSLSATSAIAQAGDKMNPGDDLPAINTTLQNANGSSTTLNGAAKENGLLVMFSCNTCPFVVKNEPIIKKVMSYATAHKIGMVVINSNEAKRGDDDSYEAMKKYAKAQGYTVPYVVDENSKLADVFGANHTPEIFLFNNKGKLVYKGAMNDNPGNPESYKKMYAEDAINAMIAGKEVDPKTTRSIGCSIKRKA